VISAGAPLGKVEVSVDVVHAETWIGVEQEPLVEIVPDGDSDEDGNT